MGVPLVCAAILVKEQGFLSQTCSSQGTDYVHDEENATGNYNPVQMSLQCSRKVDSLKFWLAWQYHGHLGYERMVDRLFELAKYAVGFIGRSEDLELMVQPEFLNICFRYHPAIAHLSVEDLNQLNLDIRDRLFRSGQTFVNYARYQEQVAIRLILTNPELQPQDLDNFFHQVINAGNAIATCGS
jgi:glutamate/tyrosine decarboxylase-like PLP-dependent enzyme